MHEVILRSTPGGRKFMENTIRIENVKKTLKRRNILKGISFEVSRGDIFGFLGKNGAGKTTTIRIIMGLYKADSGKVEILGDSADSSKVRKKVGFVLDRDGLYDGMSAEDNLAYYLRLYGKTADSSAIEKALGLVGLKDRAKDKIGTYSKGMRQRAAIARAVVHDPEILILDEPTSGVDPSEQISIRNMLLEIAGGENKTVFLSTHNMDEVQRICNKIAILNKGQIQLCGELNDIRNKMGSNAVTIQVNGDLPDEFNKRLLADKKLGFEYRNESGLVFKPVAGVKTSDIVNILAGSGIEINGIIKNEMSIEEMYTSIVKESEST